MTFKATRMLALTALIVSLAPIGSAHAQNSVDATRAMLYLALGGGGQSEFNANESNGLANFSGSADNQATVGVGARLEAPLGSYVSLGGMVDMLSYKVEDRDRHPSGHFDAWLKGRAVLDLTASVDLELYLGVPVGFSIVAQEQNNAFDREKRWLGWNIGALAGAQALFSESFGVMLELGWRRVQVYNHVDLAVTGADLNTRFNQFALNLGGVMLF